MGLSYTSLQKAIVALEKGMTIYQKKKEQDVSEDEMEIVQSGIIQNFEFLPYAKKLIERLEK